MRARPYNKWMKTKLIKSALVLTLLSLHIPSYAGSDRDKDKDYDYAYYIMSPKNSHGGKHHGEDKTLRLSGKSGETKNISFKGSVLIPDSVKVNASLLREGPSQVYLAFDNVQCKYETKVNRRFFNFYYPLVSCSDGSRAKEEIRVDSKISLYLKETKGFPATAYVTIKVLETYVRGITLPQLESEKGQILRFDGELWVPTDYIPDGQAAGDVLVWDGSGWTASKITSTGTPGAQGEKGDKGDKGDTGLQGPQGLTGPAGIAGAQGPQGPQGPAGLTGAAGSAGAKGDKGDKGDTGAQGLQGPVGLTGATGSAGAKGDKGDKGDTGAQGPQGLQGPVGLTGAAGVAGAKGDKGDKGDKGEAGDPGLVSLTAGNGILGGTIQGNGGVIAVNVGTSAGQIPVIGSNGRLPASLIDSQKTVYIKDIKPSGTHGGSCDPTKGWEQVRDLNSLSGDASFVSLAQNQITLGAGTYEIEASTPAYLDGFHKSVLVNAQTNEFVLIGSNARSHNVSGGMEPSKIMGAITITEPTTFVIKHRCATAMPNIGFGAATSFGVDEVYTQVKIIKAK